MQLGHRSPRQSRRRCASGLSRLIAALVLVGCGVGTANAAADCSITAVSLSFGVYDTALATADDSASTVTVTCRYIPTGATRVNYSVTISNGMNGNSATTRRMAAGTGRLGYNVFTDAARSRVWGSGSQNTEIARGSMTVGPGNGNGTRTVTHTVYGRIPQLQDAVPGTYADTLLLTLTF